MLHERRPRPKPSTDASAKPDMETVNTTERLTRLRELMKEHKVDIYSM
jgi:Xaa-Pro aminopeptidase